ncbi:Threonylcarbamoyl-AMP synthase [Novipirellula aureliae]|uniref:Threonylcarbamoyl-AMP synthase n=1 Tax=Novipirellula aureliae TaxID=2527966 RepID=A0A5C6DPD8_9BACT|nr:L-threonylcarbamoyladenylate synthase [Novipirellula aureliae]TWU36669.1 Threonylcarbamoyl-AMP synthase [Novipirellula aureliae]
MSRIEPSTNEMLDHARALLTSGRLVAIPTETVYGLAANAWDASAVRKIFSVKNRPPNNPLIVHVASLDRVVDAVRMPLAKPIESQLAAVSDLWPGPLTVVLPRGERIPDIVTAGNQTVAVRIPSHPVTLSLLNRCPFPLAAPSANRSNYVSPTTAAHCEDGLDDTVAMILDGGPCDYGVESTIVRLHESGPRLLRPGGVAAEVLAERFGLSVDTLMEVSANRQATKQLEAPGMMSQHYSPTTAVQLLYPGTTIVVPKNTGRIAFQKLADEEVSRYTVVEVLSESGDLEQVAKRLFAALRQLDQAQLTCIHIDTCSPRGIGRAIMDRLERAAAKSSEF